MTPRGLRLLGLLLAFAVALAVALHLALLGSWRWSILPELEASPGAHRLDVPTVESFATPSAGWVELAVARLRLDAPLGSGARETPPDCDGGCRLELATGKLTVFDRNRAESYEHTVALLAADRSDVSALRSPWENWRSMRALARRVALTNRLPATFRYRAPGSRGVVSHFDNREIERYVIYPYARDGTSGRVLALSGVSRETALAVLGSIRFDPQPR